MRGKHGGGGGGWKEERTRGGRGQEHGAAEGGGGGPWGPGQAKEQCLPATRLEPEALEGTGCRTPCGDGQGKALELQISGVSEVVGAVDTGVGSLG